MFKAFIWGITLLFVQQECLAKLNLREYQAPIGQEQWRVSSSRLRCGLSLKIMDYGIAYFEQYATKAPHFIMSHWQRESRGSRAKVWLYPPTWRPQLKPALIGKTYTQAESEFIVFFKRKTALLLLAGLSKGYMARVNYRSALGYQVKVDLSPIHFKGSYGRYIRCVGNLLPFNYQDIKFSTLYFNNAQEELTMRDRRQLDRIRLYVSVDPTIKSVEVAGYTDNVGRRGVNNAVSEARAKAVANYLLAKGLPERKLQVTWYGMLHPVDSNDTEIGRARNRRVTITVKK